MSNRIDDFFDEEYDKHEQSSGNANNDVFESAMNFTAPPAKSNRKLTVVFICIALVLCMGFGLFVGILIGAGDTEEGILSEVLDTLRNDYFFDISDEEWETIIANGGTALLQGVDSYGMLLSPQTAYNLIYGVSSTTSSVDGLSFGFTYYNVGSTGVMVVASVVNDTNAFGRLYDDDIVLSIKNMVGVGGSSVIDPNGDIVTSVNLATVDSSYSYYVMCDTYSATFVVLRGSEVIEVSMYRGTVGSVNNVEGYEYIQYYFGQDNTNVSTTIEMGRATSTMVYKCLDQLPSNVGYIYISEFNSSTTSDTATEFGDAMAKFASSGKDYLIVDVKGNPGGDVAIVSDIASMLATDSMLSSSQLSLYNMSSDADMLVVSMIDNSGVNTSYSRTSTYANYFDTSSDEVQIIIWTDGNSASASELLTGVLLDYGTGVQMGTTTYGKGIAQTVEPLYSYTDTVVEADGTEGTFYWCVYYTFAKYYSPFGNNIHGVGYTPEDSYNNLDSYSQLVNATVSYWS